MTREVTIIGAGIIGLASAVYLTTNGFKVRIIDRAGPGGGASYGNAGVIVQGDSDPITGPSTLLKVPKWLLDSNGPLTIRWGHLPKLSPWLLRLITESSPGNFKKNAQNLNNLTRFSNVTWRDLAEKVGGQDLLANQGWLKVYETETSFSNIAQGAIESCEQHNIKYEILTKDKIREMEPELAPRFEYALYQPETRALLSPQLMLDYMLNWLKQNGAEFEQHDIIDITPKSDKIFLKTAIGQKIECDELLIAAGGWSNKLLKTFTKPVKLQVERGYHAMISHHENGPLLNRPIMFSDHMFVIAPMLEAMRLTCQVELADIDAPPNYTRLNRLLNVARELVPKLSENVESKWMGPRPSQPDSVPTIDTHPKYKNIKFAFGHQHLGVTMAAITGKLISDIFLGNDIDIDLSPYKLYR